MRMNSAIRVLFGAVAAVGAAAASVPANAASVTLNISAGTASQTESGNVPAITMQGQVVDCSITFDISVASDITVGTAYTIPPATILGDVTSASFTTPGRAQCEPLALKPYVGSAPASSPMANTVLSATHPWPIEVTAANATTQTAAVTIQDFILYSTLYGWYCYGPVTGTYSNSLAATNPNTLAIPSQALTRVLWNGAFGGTCTIDSGILMAVTPGLISIP